MNSTLNHLNEANGFLHYELMYFDCRLRSQRQQLTELRVWVDKLAGLIAQDEALRAEVAAEIEAVDAGDLSPLGGSITEFIDRMLDRDPLHGGEGAMSPSAA